MKATTHGPEATAQGVVLGTAGPAAHHLRPPAAAQPGDKTALWGAYGYTPDEDVVRAPMTLTTWPNTIEELTWSFIDMIKDGGKMATMWGKDDGATVTFTTGKERFRIDRTPGPAALRATPPPPGGVGTILNHVRDHAWIDRRSLALHDAVAAKLEAQPELLDRARANLQRWLRLNPAPVLQEWAGLLDSLSVPALAGLLRSADERSTRLRQSSPFAGFLTAQERQAILNDYESRRT